MVWRDVSCVGWDWMDGVMVWFRKLGKNCTDDALHYTTLGREGRRGEEMR